MSKSIEPEVKLSASPLLFSNTANYINIEVFK